MVTKDNQPSKDNGCAINNFDLIARFYDELVSWAPYELWTVILLADLRKFGLEEGSRILDAACGSGLSTIPLARNGYHVTGIDRSGAMLELARGKVRNARLAVELRSADLLNIDLEETFDAVVCIHSGLDYILKLEELQRAFYNVRSCLKTGGLFAFDKCLDEPDFYHQPHEDRRRLKNGKAVMLYSWDRRKRIFRQDCRIDFRDESGDERSVRMLQLMLAVPPGKLIRMVEKAGFETLRPPRQFTITDPGMGIFRAV